MSTAKKVLHVTFDMRIGGTEQVIKNILDGNDPERFDMSIFCIEQPIGPFGELLKEQGVSIHSVCRSPGFDRNVIKHIRQHIKQNGIHIVHCHQYTPWVYGAFAALGTGCKVIFTEHGRFYPDRTSWKRRVINPFLVSITHRITSISKATSDALVKYEYIPADRIQLIYNGIKALHQDDEDVSRLKRKYGIQHVKTVLGTIARFDPIKNHTMMLQAFSKVIMEQPDCTLLLVGDGDERDNLEVLVRKLGISESVIFTGYVPQPQSLLASMDIFLLSSLSEGTSMTLLEAMSLSKPCVVTDAGGNSEIIENMSNGLVTPNDDAGAFSKAILKLIDEPGLQKKMGASALDIFDIKFSLRHMLQRFYTLYSEI